MKFKVGDRVAVYSYCDWSNEQPAGRSKAKIIEVSEKGLKLLFDEACGDVSLVWWHCVYETEAELIKAIKIWLDRLQKGRQPGHLTVQTITE